jgi:uncharacterized protein YuzE
MIKKKAIGFEVSISGRDDGTIETVYVTLLPDKVAKTVEVEEDQLLVDYNHLGQIVGIEILAPVRIRTLTQFVEGDQRTSFRRFIKSTVPDTFVHN